MRKRSLSEFVTTGVLWMINKSVFHPLGFALAFHFDEVGEFDSWSIMGRGTEPWNMGQVDEKSRFDRFQELLDEARKETNNGTEVSEDPR